MDAGDVKSNRSENDSDGEINNRSGDGKSLDEAIEKGNREHQDAQHQIPSFKLHFGLG